MIKISFGIVLLAIVSMSNVAWANGCAKTLMGNDCESNAKGISSHMRGNAAANAKAAKELRQAQKEAKKAASAIASVKK